MSGSVCVHCAVERAKAAGDVVEFGLEYLPATARTVLAERHAVELAAERAREAQLSPAERAALDGRMDLICNYAQRSSA